MTSKQLSKEEKIKLLREEFQRMDLNGDRAIKYDELLLHLNRQNVKLISKVRSTKPWRLKFTCTLTNPAMARSRKMSLLESG